MKNYAKLSNALSSRICCLYVLIFLAGCTSVPTHYSQHHSQQPIKNWQLDGKLSLRSKAQNNTVIFHWQQNDKDYLIQIILPFGQGNYVLTSQANHGASLLTTKNQRLYANNAVKLLQQVTGWNIPIDSFSYWLRGLPAPKISQTNMQFDSHGNITKMQQEDWQISFKSYLKMGNIMLPDKVFVQNNQFQLKLVLWNWDIQS